MTDRVGVNPALPRALVKEYTKWWVQDSFAADAFVSKGVRDILTNGAVFDCKWPANYIILAASGLRYLKDESKIVENWEIFRNYVNDDAAIVMAHMFYQRDRDTWEGVFRVNNSNHTFFQKHWGKEEFTKTVNHDLSNMETLLPMEKDTNYFPLVAILSSRLGNTPSNTPSWQIPNGNISYPRTKTRITTRDSWGDNYTVDVYDVRDIEEWIKETYRLNYLGAKRNGKS